jgi:hypothetical protein
LKALELLMTLKKSYDWKIYVSDCKCHPHIKVITVITMIFNNRKHHGISFPFSREKRVLNENEYFLQQCHFNGVEGYGRKRVKSTLE